MTRRSDPLLRRVEAFCGKWNMLPRGGLVLCAVSGGRDSMAMLHLLSALAEEGGFCLAAAHFNHCLRAAADRDEQFVRDWCRERNIPLTCGRGDVRAFAQREGLGIEAAARTLRYQFLEETADVMGAGRIATAHHREDNAETALLHLLRGSGLHGLGGIAPVRGRIVRPLLEVSREEIDAYAARSGVPWVEDESNRDVRFTRNRLRLEVLPLLEEICPGAAERIAGAAALLREEDEHMGREAEALLPAVENGAIVLPVPVLNKQDEALRRRLVRTMGRRLGAELTRAQTEAVLALKSGGFLDLPQGLCAVRRPHQLILERVPVPLAPLTLPTERLEWCPDGGILHPWRGEKWEWGPWRIRIFPWPGASEDWADTVCLRHTGSTLTIAPWDGTGRLAVENGSRTVKRLFADAGIPVEERWEHPALYRDGRCIAVFGVAVDWNERPVPGEPALAVTLEPLSEAPAENTDEYKT